MKIIKLCLIAGLVSTSFSAFADAKTDQATFTQCPPASALHHVQGQAWILDEPYKSQGWMIAQDPWVNWSNLQSLPNTTPLSVRVTDESAYLDTGKTIKEKITNPDGSVYEETYHVFEGAGGSFPITCSYPYKVKSDSDSFDETLILKSPYTSTPNFTMDPQSGFKYQNDCVGRKADEGYDSCKFNPPEANWGWVCITSAGTPAACKIQIKDVKNPPLATVTKPTVTKAIKK